MADIDKPLPNTKTTVEIPGEVEIEESIKENVEEIQTDVRAIAEKTVEEVAGKEINMLWL